MLDDDEVGRSASAPLSSFPEHADAIRRDFSDEDLNTDDGTGIEDGDSEEETISLKDLKRVLGLRELLIYLITVFFYGAVFVFVSYGGDYIKENGQHAQRKQNFFSRFPTSFLPVRVPCAVISLTNSAEGSCGLQDLPYPYARSIFS